MGNINWNPANSPIFQSVVQPALNLGGAVIGDPTLGSQVATAGAAIQNAVNPPAASGTSAPTAPPQAPTPAAATQPASQTAAGAPTNPVILFAFVALIVLLIFLR